VAAREFPGTWSEREKWYDTEYAIERIPDGFLAEIKQTKPLPELHLPFENQFIPKNLETKTVENRELAAGPKLIRNGALLRTWYKTDFQVPGYKNGFRIPETSLFIYCRSTLPNSTAGNCLKSRIYTNMVNDALEEYSYDLSLANLTFFLKSCTTGITIEISGYDKMLLLLLEKVLITMRYLDVKLDRFEVVKENLFQLLVNSDFLDPYSQVDLFAEWLNDDKGYISDQLLPVLPHLTATDIEEFRSNLFRHMHIEIFVHGNMCKRDALDLSNLVECTFCPGPLPQIEWPIDRSVVFPPGGNFIYRRTLDPAITNHGIKYFLYIGDKFDGHGRAKTLLFDQMTHEPAYNRLRTEEKLGYVVLSGSCEFSTTIGYSVTIQSEKSPEYLEERIDSFLTSYAEPLASMSESEFEGHKRSLILKLMEKSKNLKEESDRLWSHIEEGDFNFELGNDAAQVEALTKRNMIEFFNHFILSSSPLRSKFSVHLNAQKSPKAQMALKEDKNTTENSKGEIVKIGAQGNGAALFTIMGIREFKSMMTVNLGPQPVKDVETCIGALEACSV
jgi:insulysin